MLLNLKYLKQNDVKFRVFKTYWIFYGSWLICQLTSDHFLNIGNKVISFG